MTLEDYLEHYPYTNIMVTKDDETYWHTQILTDFNKRDYQFYSFTVPWNCENMVGYDCNENIFAISCT